MQKTNDRETGKRLATFVLLAVGVAAGYVLLLAFATGAGFASQGGEANIFSPHSTVDVDGENSGQIMSIVGDDNSAYISPDQAQRFESEQHKAGELLGLLFWFCLLVGLLFFIYRRLKKYGYVGGSDD